MRRRRYVMYGGLVATVGWWAARFGIPAETIHRRLSLGWPAAEAIRTPVGERPRKCPGVIHHGGTDQACVRYKVGGRRVWVYLGVWGTDAAHDAYARFARRWPSMSVGLNSRLNPAEGNSAAV